ncbi:GvpL/GvpF family gas vesicle protein [Streptomyces sp. TS71-3]|uniref:GvpL/GvpF family gas vesicle protein n=1 Tax=Streptomyces sp. TS71-3 TaxID=2733862 RepID=UPI001B0EAEDE|nr:GvpL/GvpF family gas vesicle protein [Streptomyces sp. TS71-3]GHJ41425.1 gas vesicle protein [Streptomyces sp. TS71-3]
MTGASSGTAVGESGTMRYVYAVCRPFTAALQAELVGVAGAPPRPLRHGELVAVVGAVPAADFSARALSEHLASPDWLTGTVRAHQRVVAALSTVTTPLPVRPVTVLRDDSAVRGLLEARGDYFRQALDRLDGRVEWGVRVYAERAEPDGTREEAGELGRRLHERLAGMARESRLDPPARPWSVHDAPPELVGPAGVLVLNAAYLLDRSVAGEFVAEVEAVKGAVAGLHVELTGPWAGYSFTERP